MNAPQLENTIEKPQHITLSIGQIIGFIITIASLLISIAYMAGGYSTEFQSMKDDIVEGKKIGKELNQSVQQLTIEVKSLREELNVNKRYRTTPER